MEVLITAPACRKWIKPLDNCCLSNNKSVGTVSSSIFIHFEPDSLGGLMWIHEELGVRHDSRYSVPQPHSSHISQLGKASVYPALK